VSGFGYGEVAQHVAWCRSMFDSCREGGVWGIPRSGLVFRKERGAFVLHQVMPHEPGMPITEQELREQQEDELESMRAHFGAAGVEVRGSIGEAEASTDKLNEMREHGHVWSTETGEELFE
jgi:hypothetical protein